MRGYKGMTRDMTCRDMRFEIGKTYHVDGEIEICKAGLHFCRCLKDVFVYYDRDKSRFFEVEAEGLVITSGNKSVTSQLRVIREVTSIELNRSIYGDGYGNGYGYGNSDGDGDGNGDDYSYSYGDGYGYGYGNSDGDGNGNGITKILIFAN